MSRKNKKSFNWNEVDDTGTRLARKPAPQFNLRTIAPLTINQDLTFKAYESGSNLMLHGVAGTGKTFISMYLALREILSGNSQYEKIIVIRSVVPSRDMGFLPGGIKDKIKAYEEPYKEICDDLFSNGQGYNILKAKKLVEFTSTSFLRGMTFNKSIIIVDEFQNNSFGEINTVMTRVGENSKIIFCGDIRQSDLKKYEEKDGIRHFIEITKRMGGFDHVEFDQSDIVRSGLVKQYLIESTKYMDENNLNFML
jgi:phosphate starvation-inducible protein PhoH